jgi:hypothetical protein
MLVDKLFGMKNDNKMKLKNLLNEGSNANTNYSHLRNNYEKVLDNIPFDLMYDIENLLGSDFVEKAYKKYQDEFGKLAWYHPVHDNWLPKDQATKVETELDKFVSFIEKELNKKNAKMIADLKKGASDVKRDIKISLQPKK